MGACFVYRRDNEMRPLRGIDEKPQQAHVFSESHIRLAGFCNAPPEMPKGRFKNQFVMSKSICIFVARDHRHGTLPSSSNFIVLDNPVGWPFLTAGVHVVSQPLPGIFISQKRDHHAHRNYHTIRGAKTPKNSPRFSQASPRYFPISIAPFSASKVQLKE